MAKRRTPAMEAYERKHRKHNGEAQGASPWREAWKRLCRNRTAIFGLCLIAALILVAIFADFIAPYDYATQDYNAVKAPPSWEHPFGTDNVGRDIFSRCIYGARYSLPIGFVCVACALLVGGTIGFSAAYFGGATDNVLMRGMDIFQAIPPTLMAIAIVAALGNGITRLVLAITISYMPGCAKVCRAAIFTVKGSEYVESSRAIGARGLRLMLRHMVPNALGPIIIHAVTMLAGAILIVASLSYLGLGITLPTPEWGVLLSSGKEYLRGYPHMVLFPGLMIMLTVFAFNLFGDGLRDALDPRLK